MSTPAAFDHVVSGFDSHGVWCVADVYRPAGTGGTAAPVIVMAHGFGGVRSLRLPAYAQRFAAAGYVVVVFDYRGFGDSHGEPRQILDIAAQHDDWRAAVDFARTLDGVDPTQVIGWGTSFAGGHVITLAGTGVDFAAIIAQVPHTSGVAAVRATGLRQSVRLAPAALDDTWRAIRGREPRYVPSIGVPGSVSALAAPGADEAITRMATASGYSRDDYRDDVAARVLLRVGSYSPIRHARSIRCPALIQIATGDNIAPPSAARSTAARIGNATVREYDGGHFDPYVEPLFPRIIADQLAFLESTVPV